MYTSVGCGHVWDCSEDEMQLGDEHDLEPIDQMLPVDEESHPEATLQSPATPVSSAVTADGNPQEPSDAVSLTSPELPVPDSDDEVEPTADSPRSSTQGCEKLHLIAPPPVRRLRLRVKTSVHKEVVPPPSKPSAQLQLPSEHKEEFISRHFWNKLTATQQYNYVYEKVRSFYVSKVYENNLKGEARDECMQLAGSVRQQQGRQAFKAMDADQKRFVTRRWIELCEPPPYVDKQAKDMFQCGDGANRPLRQSRLKVLSAMFTWMLPEGFVDMSGVFDEGESTTSLGQVVKCLRQSPSVKKAWELILDHGRKCMQLAGGEDVAICLEVCPETLELQKIVRLHVHALVRSNIQQLAVQHLWKFDLGEVPAHFSTSVTGAQQQSRGRAQWSGFFYCCLKDKKGTVLAAATKQPFTGFLVNPQWILSLVQAEKLDVGPAHDLLVKCVNGSRHIKDLLVHDQEMERLAVKQAVVEAERLLKGTLKEQKSIPRWRRSLTSSRSRDIATGSWCWLARVVWARLRLPGLCVSQAWRLLK